MKKRFAEEQIIGILKEAGAGAKVAELCHKSDMSNVTYYNWKGKFGRMTMLETQRPKALEAENARLKRLIPERRRDSAALKNAVELKW